MVEPFEKCDKNGILNAEDMYSVKEELRSDKVLIDPTTITINKTELKDLANATENSYGISKLDVSDTSITTNVGVKDEVIPISDIKNEFNNRLFFCEYCQAYYEDYCTKCAVLVHILNRNVFSSTDDKGREEIPNGILEFRESLEEIGIFALKIIPEGVIFGPFSGLSATESCWKLKEGKFVANKNTSYLLNWMQCINPARNISEQNLVVFESKNNLYYRSTREILTGEELLVYFGRDYEESVNKSVEMDFVPTVEKDMKDVFACTLCCLGFSSRLYLAKHKSICPNKVIVNFSIAELVQCQFCSIYLDEQEYLQCHMNYCCDRNDRRSIPLTLGNRPMQVKGKSKHLKEFGYNCEACKFKTNRKGHLNRHIKSKHLKKVGFNCEVCEFKTNKEAELAMHIKTKHLKEFRYNCEVCTFKTNRKLHLKTHIKSKHLKEFDYRCEICKYKTNQMISLKDHMTSKHFKEFDYKCEVCDYKTNSKRNLERHMQIKHP